MDFDKGLLMISKKTFEETENALIVRLKIIPNSSKNEIIYDEDNLKVKIMAQPIENRANKSLIEFLAKKLKIAKSNINIIKGELNKEKTLLIQGLDKEKFKEKIL